MKIIETRQSKAIFPNTWNANETLFGGEALKWMDEVAYITATRYTRQKMFTISIQEIQFKKPAYKISFVEVVGNVIEVSAAKLKVKVEMFVEDMYSDQPGEKAVDGIFVFAALDENRKPQRIKLKILLTKNKDYSIVNHAQKFQMSIRYFFLLRYI